MPKQNFEFKFVPVEEIYIDERVQQRIKPGKVERISQNFDVNLAGTITLSLRKDGTLICLDGQHRVAGAKKSGVEQLPALIYSNLSLQEEARMFLGHNEKSNPTPVAKFRVSVTEKDPEAVAINEIIESFGWKVSEASTRSVPSFKAVNRAREIFGCRTRYFDDSCIYGNLLLERTLRIITVAWGNGDSKAVSAATLGGVAYMLKRYWVEVEDQRMIKALSSVTPQEFESMGKGTKDNMSIPVIEAFGFTAHRLYNKGLRARALSPWFQ